MVGKIPSYIRPISDDYVMIESRYMERLIQKGPTCCITTLAMITGRTPDEIADIAGKNRGINSNEIEDILQRFGMFVSGWRDFTGPVCKGNILPSTCLIMTECRGKDTSHHLMFRIGNKYYDPSQRHTFHKFDHAQHIIHSYMSWETFRTEYPGTLRGLPVTRFDTAWRVVREVN